MTDRFIPSWQTKVRRTLVELAKEHELPRGQAMILERLMEYAHYDTGGEARPGHKALAGDLGVSTRTVGRAIEAGLRLGVIEETRHGGGSGEDARASVYRFVPRARPARTQDSTQDKSDSLPTRGSKPPGRPSSLKRHNVVFRPTEEVDRERRARRPETAHERGRLGHMEIAKGYAQPWRRESEEPEAHEPQPDDYESLEGYEAESLTVQQAWLPNDSPDSYED